MDIVEYLDRAGDKRWLTPLSKVQSWHRGGHQGVCVVESDDEHLFDRLITVDEEGIRTIEKLVSEGPRQKENTMCYCASRPEHSCRHHGAYMSFFAAHCSRS